MKVSLNTIKQYIDFDLPPVDELVERINSQLGGVEEVIDLADKYKDAVIVKVVACEKHPNADKLNVTKVDDGGVVADVPRDDQGLVQVVCGAPNVHADMWAVWLPPRSTVPASYDDAEPFVLGARELRGVMSQGMLAAGDELALNSNHDGILEVNADEWRPYDVAIAPGVSFAKAYGLDDTIIDIENKMFTHRPDLFGQLGVAREIAGILGHKFTSPSWYADAPTFQIPSDENTLPLEVFSEAGDKVPRVMFVAMSNIEIKPSPLWLQAALVAMGSKSINNIVDVTNYVMLLTAQPTHAYDYDKLRGHSIGARMANNGETITLLNGKTYTLTDGDIVIADGEGPVGLGGIMGGADSEVDDNTKNIVLEVATFDMYTVRKMSMRHGVFTDALTRFNKGQSPRQNDHVMNLLMMSVTDVSRAEQASEVFDKNNSGDDDRRWEPETIATSFINQRLGTHLRDKEMVTLLENVEFHSHDMGGQDEICVTAPFWRTDIEQPEDIVEEVGRLYGFDKLPRELPTRSIAPAPLNHTLMTKRRIREVLLRAGANEALTYSFVHEKTLVNAGQNPAMAFRLTNALSPDLQYYRLSLTPSLLAAVHGNIRAGHDEFIMYELGKAHHKEVQDEEGLPRELDRLAFVYANKKPQDGAAYYHARAVLDDLMNHFHLTDAVRLEPLDQFDDKGFDALRQMTAPYEPKRSAFVWIGDQFAGVVGELRAEVSRAFKLPAYTAAGELFLSTFLKAPTSARYRPLSKFPSVTQDVTVTVPAGASYQDVFQAVRGVVRGFQDTYQIDLWPIGIYRPSPDAEQKSLSFRLRVTSHERTLADKDVSEITEQILSSTK